MLPDEYQRNRGIRVPGTEASDSPRNRVMRNFFRQSTLAGNAANADVQPVGEMAQDDLEAFSPSLDANISVQNEFRGER